MEEVAGVSGQIIRALQSMYAKATARVKLTTSEATKSFSCQKGVRQGCNLSPLLFSFFLSGLETEMVKHEAGVPLMDETLNMMILCYYQQVRRDCMDQTCLSLINL